MGPAREAILGWKIQYPLRHRLGMFQSYPLRLRYAQRPMPRRAEPEALRVRPLASLEARQEPLLSYRQAQPQQPMLSWRLRSRYEHRGTSRGIPEPDHWRTR